MTTAVLELETLGSPELRWGPPSLETLDHQAQSDMLELSRRESEFRLSDEFDPVALDNLDHNFNPRKISPIPSPKDTAGDILAEGLVVRAEVTGIIAKWVARFRRKDATVEQKAVEAKKFERLRRKFWKVAGVLGVSTVAFAVMSEDTEVFAEGNNPPGIPADWVECNGGPGSKSAPVIDQNGNQRDVYYCAPAPNTTQATTTTTQAPAPVTTQKPAQTNPPVVVQPTVVVTSPPETQPPETQAPTTSSEAPVSVTTTTIEEEDGTTTTGGNATTTTKGVTTTTENENPTTTTTNEASIADEDDDRDSSNGIPGWVIPVGAGTVVALAFGAKFYLGRDREEQSSDDFGGTGVVAGH